MTPILKLISTLLVAPVVLHASDVDSLSWPAPTRDVKPWTAWWWMGNAVDKATITRELTEFRDAGFGGVEVGMFYGAKGAEDRYIDFLSPRWMEMLAHASNEAQRLGMRLDMSTVAGWPFGGPNVSAPMASSRVNVTSYPIASGQRLMTRLPSRRFAADLQIKPNADGQIPVSKEALGELQVAMAVSESGETKDVTEHVRDDGQLEWMPPSDGWRVWVVSRIAPIQTVKRPAPGSAGYALDPFSAAAMSAYLKRFDDAFMGFTAPKPNAQFHESFEYFGADWSTKVFEPFQQKRGYDLRTQLPAFAGTGPEEIVSRVRTDYRETMSDLHLSFLNTWSDWAHSQGSLSRNQAHGSPGNMLDHYAAADIPETEAYKQDRSLLVMKFASSAAHTTGKPLVSSETGTWVKEHFTETLSDLKALVDDFFLGGVNRVKFHGAASSPADVRWPGWMFYAATQFNSRNPIWHDVPAFTSYISRCQSVLQAGRPDNDVLLYWPVHDLWKKPAEFNTPTQKAAGALPHHNVHERAWFESQPVGEIAAQLWKRGYGFDFVSDRQLSVATVNGSVDLAGTKYQVILVPPCETMPETTLARLLSLAEAGATVIFADHLPKDVPGLGKLEERRGEFRTQLARIVFSKDSKMAVKLAPLGKGKVLQCSVEAGLNEAKVPRESMTDSGTLFIRRTEASGRSYFMSNRSGKRFDGWLTLATPTKSCVLMDPMSGRTGVALMRNLESQAEVYVQLNPGESLVLRAITGQDRELPADAPRWTYSKAQGQPIALVGKWTVDFLQGGPVLPPPAQLTDLASWTNLDPEAARFAGTARYRITFDAPQSVSGQWFLDLGNVAQSARIRLNGSNLGTLIAAPYQVMLPGLKAQGNELEIEVTNVAANRIRDLDQRHVEWRIFHDINFMSILGKRFDASAWPLTDSGLLGPVTLQEVRKFGENLLQYPGFENAEGWKLPATGSIEPKSGRNGTPALVIKESGIESPYARIAVSDIRGSRDYFFRAWIKSTKGGGEGPKLKIEFYNHEGKYIGGEHSPAFSVGQYGAWVKVEVKLSAPQDTANALLMLRQFGSGESVFDDLEFISRELVPCELAVEQRSAYARKGGSLDSAAIMHMNRDPSVAKGMTATVTVTDSKGDSVFTSEPQRADKKVLKFPFRISTDKVERYTVTARLFNPDSSLLLETKDIIAIVKQPSSFANGHYEVDGKPFFPIGIWHVGEPGKEFPMLHDAGFNAVQGTTINDLNKLSRYMDLAAAHQIYVFLPLYAEMKVKENFENSQSKMRLLKDHPALLSYWLQDEPDRWKTQTSELVELRWMLNENDPKHPGSVMMFGTSTRFMEQQQAVDIIYVDPYPTRKVSLPHTEVRDEIERAKKAGKPIAIAIQAFEMLPHWVKPSVAEFENYVYQALIHGVVGVTYFSLHEAGWNLSTSDLWPSVKAMNHEIATLAPVLLSAEMRRASWSVKSNDDIDWVAAIVNGETYLLAVNVTEKPQRLNALLPEGTKGSLYPLFDRTGAVLKDNRASEVIEGFGTRAYVIR